MDISRSQSTVRILAAAGLLFLMAGKAQAADTGCQLVSYASLPMRTTAGGRVTVPMKLGDREYYFPPDTGGWVSTINSDIVDSMKLSRVSSAWNIIGVGAAKTMTQVVFVADFSIGLVRGHDFKFYVDPDNSRELAGLIAPNLLRNFDLDFDFAAGKLNLISKNPCPGSEVYWTKGPVAVVPMTIDAQSHIWIPVMVDGKKVMAMVDTGATDSVMGIGVAHVQLNNVDVRDPQFKAQPTTVNGVPVYSYPFKAINFEGVTVANPHILLIPDAALAGLRTNMILGANILRQLHMYISYTESKMYLTAATAH